MSALISRWMRQKEFEFCRKSLKTIFTTNLLFPGKRSSRAQSAIMASPEQVIFNNKTGPGNLTVEIERIICVQLFFYVWLLDYSIYPAVVAWVAKASIFHSLNSAL